MWYLLLHTYYKTVRVPVWEAKINFEKLIEYHKVFPNCIFSVRKKRKHSQIPFCHVRMQWGRAAAAWKRSELCQALNTTALTCDNLVWLF